MSTWIEKEQNVIKNNFRHWSYKSNFATSNRTLLLLAFRIIHHECVDCHRVRNYYTPIKCKSILNINMPVVLDESEAKG